MVHPSAGSESPRHPRNKICLILGAVLLASGLSAQTNNPEGKILILPTARVNAASNSPLTVLSPDQAALRLLLVPGAVQLIGDETTHDGRSGSFLDLLSHAPGIILGTDNAGEAEKISIRGSGIQSDNPLGVELLVDGLPYNQGDGEANLEEMDLGAIKAAEIYRGANALRYGSYVLGGAINLLSRTGRDSPGTSLSFQAGSFGYLRGQASWGQASGSTDLFVDLSARQIDGFRDHSAENAEVASLNAGFRLNANAENRIYFSASRWDRLIPGDLTAEELANSPRQASDDAIDGDFRTHTRSLRVADIFVTDTTSGHWEAGLFFHHRDFLIYDLYATDYRLGATDAHSDNTGGSLTWTRELEVAGLAHHFLLGLAPMEETERSRNFKNDAGTIDRNTMTADFSDQSINLPLFFEDRITLTPALSLNLGLQAVFIRRRFTDFDWTDDDGNQSRAQDFRALSPKFGVINQLSPNTQVFANISRGFQPPSIDDLTPFQAGENGSVVYMPLAAQHAWTGEIGTRGRHGVAEWDLALYQSEWRNELLELNDATGHSLGTVNANRTRHAGLEAGLTLAHSPHETDQPATGWSLQLEYTLNDFRFRHDPVYGNNRIAGIPVHLFNAELIYRAKNGFYFGPNVEYSPQRYAVDEANTLFADSYALLGVKLGIQRERFRLFVEFRNLSNSRYASMIKPIADARISDDDDLQLFSPGAPRNISGGLSVYW